jgi:endonuclease YncB( thermonuclease family)
MRARLPLVGLLLAATLTAAPRLSFAQPETFSGKVVGVTDGDTLRVLRGGREVKIRLHGIDAPETGQAFGDAAKRLTSERVFGKSVTVRVLEKDRYGRLVGVVTSSDGASSNEALVQSGFAWWYHQYGAKERKLAELEIDARSSPGAVEGC